MNHFYAFSDNDIREMTLSEVNVKLKSLDKIIEARTHIVANAISLCFGSGEEEKKPETNEDVIKHLKEVGIKPPANIR